MPLNRKGKSQLGVGYPQKEILHSILLYFLAYEHLLFFYSKRLICILLFNCCHIYIYIYIRQSVNIHGTFNKFPDLFVQAFKIVVDSWKFTMLLLYILWDDTQIFMISGSNEHIHQQLEYTLLKPDCHSRRISKIQSGRDDTLEERYAIKFCFKLGKNATETYGMLRTAFGASCMSRASVFEWHKEGRGVCEGWWEVLEE